MVAETRPSLRSASDTNQLPSQASLGRVEAATQTELPIRETVVQVEGCKNCNPA